MKIVSIILQTVFLALCGVTAVFHINIGWDYIHVGYFRFVALLAVLFGFVELLIVLFSVTMLVLRIVRRRGSAHNIPAICHKVLCAMQPFPLIGGIILSGVGSDGNIFAITHAIILAYGVLVLLFAAPQLVTEE